MQMFKLASNTSTINKYILFIARQSSRFNPLGLGSIEDISIGRYFNKIVLLTWMPVEIKLDLILNQQGIKMISCA